MKIHVIAIRAFHQSRIEMSIKSERSRNANMRYCPMQAALTLLIKQIVVVVMVRLNNRAQVVLLLSQKLIMTGKNRQIDQRDAFFLTSSLSF